MFNIVSFNSVEFWGELGAALSAPVSYPIPNEIKELVQVKGANGSYTETTGYFENIEIDTKFKILLGRAANHKGFHDLKRHINKIFNDIKDNRLKFSDIPDKHYKVKTVGLTGVTKTSPYEAEFEAKFICDPFMYKDGEVAEGITTSQDMQIVQYDGDTGNTPIITLDIAGVISQSNIKIEVNGGLLQFSIGSDGKIEINKNPYSIVTLDGTPIISGGVQPVLTPGPNKVNITISEGNITNATILKNTRYFG